MIGAREEPMVRPTTAGPGILRPGTNCWKLARADKFRVLQDAEDYFRAVRQALLDARTSVFVLGWDILATVDLDPASPSSDAPTRLGDLLTHLARRRPSLRCYVLVWDYAALYTLERDPLSRWRLDWKTPRHVRFGFDDRHPVGASHHQKIVVVDDRLAFCGGIDLTGHRWDTSAHRVEEPMRVSAARSYGPYHDVQAMVSGPAAAALGVLARDRWRALGEQRLPPVDKGPGDRWPSGTAADLVDVDVAVARTAPRSSTHAAVRECETLFLDSIAAAKRSIYIENQYFTNDRLGDALAARLREPDGPEIVVVAPRDCDGWLERNTMGAFRNRVFHRLLAADRHGRLRLVYPIASRERGVPTFVHSKVMVVDDELVRVGSANLSRRSMGFDTECDIAVEAKGDEATRRGIRRIRDRLVAEHLGLTDESFARALERAGTLRQVIDGHAHADRALLRIGVEDDRQSDATEALRDTADPDEPIDVPPTVTALVPSVGATYRHSALRLRIVPALLLVAGAASMWAYLIDRPSLPALEDVLEAAPRSPIVLWTAALAFLLGNLLLIPVELMAIAGGVLLGAARGSVLALVGSLGAAVIGFIAGRTIGPSGIARWMSRQSYQSGRQLGARGVVGVLVLRLASVASAGSIHLLCGASGVRFDAFMVGTVIGLVPAVAALSALGGLFRRTLLHPSLATGSATVAAALLLIAAAAGLRTFLLLRQFAPSVSRHRQRAEFG
jgi:phosphatidylserine/phosphatidylglycerophosphate/cardiolipin synthase-like enzyme/uncharacterized membrane protein YdjX (TVP38/TMEM64 family)